MFLGTKEMGERILRSIVEIETYLFRECVSEVRQLKARRSGSIQMISHIQ